MEITISNIVRYIRRRHGLPATKSYLITRIRRHRRLLEDALTPETDRVQIHRDLAACSAILADMEVKNRRA